MYNYVLYIYIHTYIYNSWKKKTYIEDTSELTCPLPACITGEKSRCTGENNLKCGNLTNLSTKFGKVLKSHPGYFSKKLPKETWKLGVSPPTLQMGSQQEKYEDGSQTHLCDGVEDLVAQVRNHLWSFCSSERFCLPKFSWCFYKIFSHLWFLQRCFWVNPKLPSMLAQELRPILQEA